MERSYIQVVIIFLLIILSTPSKASQDVIYRCFASGNMTQWKQEIIDLEENANTNDAYLLDMLDHYYGYIGWCLSNNREDEAEKYMDKSEDLVKKLKKRGNHESTVLAYKSAFIGFQIQLTPYKAPFIGMKALTYAEESIELDHTNDLGHQLLAHCLYYMPSVIGGSKTKALEHYLKALQIYEDENRDIRNWQYLQLLKITADCYEAAENREKTLEYYQRILKVEPEFLWIKNKEYPRIKRKYNIAD